MAEVLAGFTTDDTLYFIVANSSGNYWDDVANGFEAFDNASLGDYDIPMTEDGTPNGIGIYRGTFPAHANMVDGIYDVIVMQQVAGSPALGDIAVAVATYSWDGTTLRAISDVTGWNTEAVATPSIAGVPEVDMTHIIGNSGAANGLKSVTDMIVTSGTAQGPGANSNQIQLAAGEPATADIFDPSMVLLTGGTGVGQSRRIIEYDGSTKIAVVSRTWKTNPDNTSEYAIFADPGGLHVNEGLAQAGGPSTITLNALASSSDDAYKGQTVFLVSGLGEDQARIVTAFDGTSKIATVDRAWDTNPDDTTGYLMLPMLDCANVERINGDAASVTRFKRAVDAVLTGSVVADGTNSITEFDTDLATENANYYGDADGGLVIAFIQGTGNAFQTRRIIASVTSVTETRITLEAALDAIPTASDEFVVLGRITELS